MDKSFNVSDRKKSFLHAIVGLKYIFATQHNFRIHSIATILIVSLGLLYGISITEWCFLIFSIGFVLAAEAFNTAIECVTDLASPDFHRLAKTTKDASAGAVLLAALTSLIVGAIIFVPKIL